MGSGKYAVSYTHAARADITALRAFDRAQIREAVEMFLAGDPFRESKSRIKRMAQPFWCQFRLRVGEFRVYYNVDEMDEHVQILRVLLKGSSPTPTEEP